MAAPPDLLTKTPVLESGARMDALSDALRVMGLTGGVFLDAAFSAPWCVLGKIGEGDCKPYLSAPSKVICFHYVVEGACVAQVEGHPACELSAGEVVLLPHNDAHVLGSELGLKSVPAPELIKAPEGAGLPKIRHGGGGRTTRMVCGFLGGRALINPLLSSLPPMLKVSLADIPGGDWIGRSFTYAATDLANGGPGAATVMSKMSELLFVEVLRHFLATEPAERTGWLASLRDPAIGRALALLHSEPRRDWTTDELADRVHLSRSTFAERFTALVGRPPMRYLTEWRMQLAAQSLQQSQLAIAQIAYECGYESEATFTRAFKRAFGAPPAAWRKAAANAVPA
jgi:AraC-like DNA-binding protein